MKQTVFLFLSLKVTFNHEIVGISDVQPGPPQKFKMESFATIVNGF